MIKSETIGKIAEALASFQAEVQDPAKNSNNPFFKSKYVELDDLLASVRPVLSKHGLAVLQEPSGEDKVCIKTIIIHNSGEFIEFDPIILKPVKNDPQGVGSAITYGRRYSLSSILGVAWDNDDDGNNASGKNVNQFKIDSKQQNKQTDTNTPTQAKKHLQQENKPTANEITKPTHQQLIDLGKKATDLAINPDDIKKIMEWKFKIKSSSELTIAMYNVLFKDLDKLWCEYVSEQSKN